MYSVSSCDNVVGAAACKSAGRVAVADPRANLVSFADLLSETFKFKLTVPDDVRDVRSIKKFCSGLLEKDPSHEWARPIMANLPAVDRLSIAGSLFSFRKTLPTDEPSVDDYVRKMSGTGVKVSKDYLRFVRRKVSEMFVVGWDKHWRSSVKSTTPGTASGHGVSRKEGGVRAKLQGSRSWFIKSCMGLEKVNISTVRPVGLARCDGKIRVVTKSPPEAVLLKPLHDMIYDHLSRKEWLLRGEATPDKLEEFVRKEGEVFVSGDYESASDNLSIDVSEVIIDTMARKSRYVPKTIWKVAKESLRCVLEGETVTGLQSRGQLMGNFLCFPLLCLQNYIAFSFLTKEAKYPVKINGDDIVFRAPPSVYETWAEGVGHLGLTLSRGKTFVHPRFFSVNSTYFRGRPSSGVKGVPIVRATYIFKGVESCESIGSRINGIGRFFDQPRGERMRICVMRKLHSEIRRSQRSVRRGLGACVTARELKLAGLIEREAFYSSLPHEKRAPAKTSCSNAIPPGWSKVRPRWQDHGLEDDPEFRKELVLFAWNSKIERLSTDRYWEILREGTVTFRPRRGGDYRKCARLLRVSVGEARKFLSPKIESFRQPGKGVWRRLGDGRS